MRGITLIRASATVIPADPVNFEFVFIASGTDRASPDLPARLELGPPSNHLVQTLTSHGLLPADVPVEVGMALVPFAPPDPVFPALRHPAVPDWGGREDPTLPPCGIRTLPISIGGPITPERQAALAIPDARGDQRLIDIAGILERRLMLKLGHDVVLTPIAYLEASAQRAATYLNALDAVLTGQMVYARLLNSGPLVAVVTLHGGFGAIVDATDRATRLRIAFFDDVHRLLLTAEFQPGGHALDVVAGRLVRVLEQGGPDRVEVYAEMHPLTKNGAPCFGKPSIAPGTLPWRH